MKNYKYLLILGLAIVFGSGAQKGCDRSGSGNKNQTRQNMNKTPANSPKPLETPTVEPAGDEIKTLAEGGDGKIETPFMFVARTPETYRQLREMAEGLPPAAGLDFNKTAVIAAFAGVKKTGGYTIGIDRTDGKLTVRVNPPPPDAIVTQALTRPFRVATVPVGEEDGFAVELSENWTNAARTYRITSGEFTYSGGFAGRTVKFEPEGKIHVLTSGDHLTLIFELTDRDGQSGRKLDEIASGTLRDGKAALERVEAGDFIERPHPPLVVSGTVSADNLALAFEPGKRDYVVNDGFEGRGKLTAAGN